MMELYSGVLHWRWTGCVLLGAVGHCYVHHAAKSGTISGPVLIANFGSLFAKMDYFSVIVQRRACSTVHNPMRMHI